MKIITITGIDKAGKSTIGNALWNGLGRIHDVIDRDISTNHFFNMLLDRIDKQDMNCYMKNYNAKLRSYRQFVDLSICLTINEDDWIKRCHDTEELPLPGAMLFKEHQNEIIRYFKKAGFKNSLFINTSEYSVDECLDIITKRLRKC